MNNDIGIHTWVTQVTTSLRNFLGSNTSFLSGKLKTNKEVAEFILNNPKIAKDYSLHIPTIQDKGYFCNYRGTSKLSLSSKVYLIHKDLIYSNDNIISTLENDYHSFILLDLTDLKDRDLIDKLCIDYDYTLTSMFVDSFIDNEVEPDNNTLTITELSNIVNQQHKQMEKDIRDKLYSDHILFIPIHKYKGTYTSNMYSDCISNIDLLNSILYNYNENIFVSYLGLQIPLIIGSEAKLVYAVINNKAVVPLTMVEDNISKDISIIIWLLSNILTKKDSGKAKSTIKKHIDVTDSVSNNMRLLLSILCS